MNTEKNKLRLKRRRRCIKGKIRGTAACPRLAVFRSLKHISVQIIDDDIGKTILSVSSQSPEIKADMKYCGNNAAAAAVGAIAGKKAMEKQISKIVFDRGGKKYHGRIKALADAARESGLKF